MRRTQRRPHRANHWSERVLQPRRTSRRRDRRIASDLSLRRLSWTSRSLGAGPLALATLSRRIDPEDQSKDHGKWCQEGAIMMHMTATHGLSSLRDLSRPDARSRRRKWDCAGSVDPDHAARQVRVRCLARGGCGRVLRAIPSVGGTGYARATEVASATTFHRFWNTLASRKSSTTPATTVCEPLGESTLASGANPKSIRGYDPGSVIDDSDAERIPALAGRDGRHRSSG